MSHIDHLRDDLATVEERIDYLKERAQGFREVIAYYEGQPDVDASAGQRLADTMVSILTAAGQPLHYRDIYEQLVQRGRPVPGLNPARNTGAHLSLDRRFLSYGQGVWGLAAGQQAAPQPTMNCGARGKEVDHAHP